MEKVTEKWFRFFFSTRVMLYSHRRRKFSVHQVSINYETENFLTIWNIPGTKQGKLALVVWASMTKIMHLLKVHSEKTKGLFLLKIDIKYHHFAFVKFIWQGPLFSVAVFKRFVKCYILIPKSLFKAILIPEETANQDIYYAQNG